MLRNSLTIAIRNLWRNKTFSIINILGLTLGMTGSFLVFLWVSYTISFDQFHTKIDRIYHVFANMEMHDKTETWWNLPYPATQHIKKDVSEVEEMVIYSEGNYQRLSVDQLSFTQSGLYASNDFFKVFSFPSIIGDENTALKEPASIVITEKVARKLFPDFQNDFSNVIGKNISIDKWKNHKITGILYDIPKNSNIAFDYILPIQNLLIENPGWANAWGDYNFRTYVLFRKDANIELAQKKIKGVLMKHSPNDFKEYKTDLFLFSHKSLNLHAKFENGKSVGGKISLVWSLAIAGMVLLLVCSINFINLVLASTSARTKEIGVHLVYGASKKDLFTRHFLEIFIQICLASFISGLFLLNVWPWYKNFTEIEINRVFNFNEIAIAAYLVFVLVILLVAVYPSVVFSSLKPNDLFHKRIFKHFAIGGLRKWLIIVQITVSSVFIVVSIFIFEQTQYLLTKNLGQNISNVVSTWFVGAMMDNRDAIKSQIAALKDVKSLSFSSSHPLRCFSHTTDPTWKDKGTKSGSFYVVQTDYDFLKTLGIKLTQGRDFDKSLRTDTAHYLINETMKRFMETKNEVREELEFWGNRGEILGVVEDFHFQNMHEPIRPLIIKLVPKNSYCLLINFEKSIKAEKLDEIRKILYQYSSGNEIEFAKIENDFRDSFVQDINYSVLAFILAVITILLSALGLLGITMFSLEKRKKEISIRKVAGASVLQLHWLVAKDFLLLVIIANIIGWPLAYMVVNYSLSIYAYHIEIYNNYWIFLFSTLVLMMVGYVTISYETIKAGLDNPVKYLKNE